ncbi:MAG: hypothetical protein KJP00_05880 [Bacteroidia bacterium]|nr:hypothetical protein [Bacteroidia bacterium]
MKASYIYLVSIVVILCSIQLAHSQNSQGDGEEYLIEHFELPDGPTGNNVNCIVQGPNGFLWFGSHNGLYRYDGYQIKSYKANPADSTSLVFAYIEWLYWSSDDYLWIGTYGGGLFQFDPSDETFIRYQFDPDDPHSISGNNVTEILEENENTIWIATTNGLNRLDRSTGQFKRFIHDPNDPNSLSFNIVRALYFDRDSTLWIGTGFIYQTDLTQGGLNRYHPESETFTSYKHDPKDPSSLMGNFIRSIYEDSKGNFWVGGNGGLHLMDRSTGKFIRMIDDPDIEGDIYAPGIEGNIRSSLHSIIEDQDQNLWLFSLHNVFNENLGSIAKVDLETFKMETIKEAVDIIPWQTMQCKDGSIWISGAGVGGKVHKIRPSNPQLRFIPFIIEEGGVSKSLTFEGLAQDQNGRLWGKTTSSEGIAQIIGINDDYQDFGIRNLPEIKSRREATDASQYIDFAGIGIVILNDQIWGCTGMHHGGLFSLDPSAAEASQFVHDPDDPNSILYNDIGNLISDQKRHLWLGSLNSVSRFDPSSNILTHYERDSQVLEVLGRRYIYRLFEDKDGYIWIGGENQNITVMLERLDPETGEGKQVIFPENYTGAGGGVNYIAQSGNGDIYFVISNQKLHVLPHELLDLPEWSSDHFQVVEDPIFQNITNLISDDHGMLWMTNADGQVIRYDPDEESKTIFHDRRDLEFKNGAFKVNDGTIYFGYQEGLIEVNPSFNSSTSFFKHDSRVRFTEFFFNGQSAHKGDQSVQDLPIWKESELQLSYEQGSFGFRFSAFDLKNPVNCQYDVRLSPGETQWRRLKGEPILNYYQLPPGQYTLEVKGSNSYGIWAEETAKINIEISPPWWRTWLAYTMYGLLAMILLGLIWQNQRRKIIQIERQRTLEKELEQSRKIEKAYAELKTTQSQLIQSEKMASLGELTAGIAHEIQNPLNFVNNFSEVNQELLEELKDEVEKGDLDEVRALAKDIIENEEKIKHHGTRADAIVKGMLEHSRTSTGKKVMTNLNELADEYLRLAYHGIKAKDAAFDASFETNFDPDLPKVNIIPQDIGRVILNLAKNAFQACAERSRSAVSSVALAKEGGAYEPKVTVTTQQLNNSTIQLTITDNGPGIPDDIKDKIFQPFFTTKPTGEGTGLGLSLSYDIIKAHRGEIKVTSSEGKGTEFIIRLPYST